MSLGSVIRQARIDAGLSIDDLSERTSIRGGLLKEIESDDFTKCGGETYARGHLRNIAPQIKMDASLLLELYESEQSMQPRFPHVAVPDLQAAWADILRRAKLIQHHKISRQELSVREHMSIVLRHLQGRKFVEFENLFDPSKGTPVLVVTFIALLELAKETLIEITQAEAFAPIYVRLAFTPV